MTNSSEYKAACRCFNLKCVQRGCNLCLRRVYSDLYCLSMTNVFDLIPRSSFLKRLERLWNANYTSSGGEIHNTTAGKPLNHIYTHSAEEITDKT